MNLELDKKPFQCLEYLVVHELAHLIERHHNERFIAIMDKHLPRWRRDRAELNSAPLALRHPGLLIGPVLQSERHAQVDGVQGLLFHNHMPEEAFHFRENGK